MKTVEAIIIGTVGFLLYFLYDINSIKWKNSVLQKFFAIGSICVAGSTAWVLVESLSRKIVHPAVCVILGAGSLIFLGLLIYTLFFALPFDETYVKESKERMAYTEGVYSLCRHPGVLWFAGAYLCFWGISGELDKGIYFISMIFWNYMYIIVQDYWIFPATFINYEEYKKKTPFLLPDRKSINAYLLWNAERKETKGE
ncbi:hypothetical protein [Faecalicatena contorta]|uniref:hypothetical protein n=1 Tax=Faecalicatena contorta TaxID=39482 RepID=UPI001F1618DC|nr:hypothetical protein [Faecalicatena contorta]MCF2554237.1 hypothetical protein [Faecalicatena contorta]